MMNRIQKLAASASIILLLLLAAVPAKAQCPICKANVESAMLDEENTVGLGLNDGILYLLAAPYLAVGVIVGLWFYNRKKKAESATQSPFQA